MSGFPKTFGLYPNGTGVTTAASFTELASGVFTTLGFEPTSKASNVSGTAFGGKNLSFNLSNSNSIYGSSNKVQARSYQLLMIIKN